jgi:hypothetical protein
MPVVDHAVAKLYMLHFSTTQTQSLLSITVRGEGKQRVKITTRITSNLPD